MNRQANLISYCCILIALAVLSGCSSIPVIPPEPASQNSQETVVAKPKIEYESVTAEELREDIGREPGPFRVKIGDRLRVLVWGHPELGHIADVHPNGAITLPLVGEVFIEGMTLPESVEHITERLEKYQSFQSNGVSEGDQIGVSVWGYPELTSSAMVQSGGAIQAPLVGGVEVVGRNMEEIKTEIEERMEQYIEDPIVSVQPQVVGRQVLVDPVVSVLPEEVRPRKVAVIGEVGLPGLYSIDTSLTVLEALANARYLRSGAMNSVIVIRGYESEKPQYKKLRVKDFLEGRIADNQNMFLTDRDIVIVPKRFITKVSDFVQDFLVSTVPVFNYWTAAYEAFGAKDVREIISRVNRLDGRAERKVDVEETQASFGSLLDRRLNSSILRSQND